ncbi:hypothetical protein B296_00013483 [Ensete ventricosum]|uniref:Uncharacterized protein n=1 Tax=Ensete ventricosum TaxID=4639 RepID=A0A427AVQ4_ENSVE|nr:hypothetical protein B296_00013483 [Ensete ventricosum]
MTKYFKIFQISCLENAKVDALARLAFADAANELPIIPSLCQSTVAIVEMATTTTIENFTPEASEAGLRENLDMLEERRAKAHLKNLYYHRAVSSSPIQIGVQEPDFLLKLPPLAPEGLQLSPHLLNFALQLFRPSLNDCDQLLVDSYLQLLVHSPKSQYLFMLAPNQSARIMDPIDKGIDEVKPLQAKGS